MSQSETSKIPILTYHSIDDSGSVISTSEDTFRKQMQFLKYAGFNVVSLKTLGESFSRNVLLPPKTIVLTFDDGFQNFYATAFPVLDEYKFPSTVFLITDYCGKLNDWTGNLPSLEARKLMNWNEITELSKNKVDFAAHSRTHPDLTKLNLQKAASEIVQSKLIIEERLGVEVTDFAYPYGKYNLPVKRLAENHFRTACSTRLGKVQVGDDLFSLKRVDAYYLSSERLFKSILSFNFNLYLNFRQFLRELKQTISYNK